MLSSQVTEIYLSCFGISNNCCPWLVLLRKLMVLYILFLSICIFLCNNPYEPFVPTNITLRFFFGSNTSTMKEILKIDSKLLKSYMFHF